MTFTKIAGISLTALLSVTVLAGCSPSTGDGTETTVLKVAFNQGEDHPQYVAMEALGEALSERTDGAFEIQMFPNELLGSQQETIANVQSGSIDMSLIVGSLLENVNPDFVAFNLPYVFDSSEQQMSVLNDPAIVGDLYASMEDTGITVAGSFHSGVRNVYTKTGPIETPADLAGQKIRVIQNDTMTTMMNLMGGSGTPMGQGDVYTAIQSGVLDGGENNELIYNGLKHDEVAPYYARTNHLMVPDYLVVNTALLAGMSAEHRAIFEEEFAAAVELEVDLWNDSEETAITAAEAAGATFNDVDTDLFKEAVQPLVDDKLSASSVAQALYDSVQNAE
ncbi:TRAP transporter substrate-binding protein [Cryobacterium frigoriphilum]|uniref:TRAP transporter substrate-binding protein n=1 Tax=Cryobacterium frigoriphilum TaxID=1259150 RepID=A0A4R9A7D2_9MICO|nr:TRAP transporter substrate-binding protein [Cryobacterium frigoriphilum]TFD53558.1 TRAP transporter substrate-binding protein [Cryobacterium frigoriphilum]